MFDGRFVATAMNPQRDKRAPRAAMHLGQGERLPVVGMDEVRSLFEIGARSACFSLRLGLGLGPPLAWALSGDEPRLGGNTDLVARSLHRRVKQQ